MKYFSEGACEGIFVTTKSSLTNDTNVNPKCIGIRGCVGGNNGYNYYIKHCKILGVGTAFQIAGEHLIMEQCSAQRCGYGFAIGNVSFLESWSGVGTNIGCHNLSINNVCFEYTWGGFIFGNDSNCTNAISITDLNCEEGTGTNGAWATKFLFREESPGAYRGIITYYLTSTDTWKKSDKNLWYSAYKNNVNEGKNWISINMMANRFGNTANRPTDVDFGFKYYDTDLEQEIFWNETEWIVNQQQQTILCTGITLDNIALSIDAAVSTTATLKATIAPSNCTQKIIWTSNNNNIVVINNGVITVKGNGTTDIIATCGEQSATCSVTVSNYTTSKNPFITATYEKGTLAESSINIGAVLSKKDIKARARITEWISCTSGTFTSLDSSKYLINVYESSSTKVRTENDIEGEGYILNGGTVNNGKGWTDTWTILSNECKYVKIAFKKIDNTDFTTEELANMCGVVFAYSN